MTKIADKIFEAMNELAEVRHIYQREHPRFGFEGNQLKATLKHLGKARRAVDFVERTLRKKQGGRARAKRKS
jgi:hypothetical protein